MGSFIFFKIEGISILRRTSRAKCPFFQTLRPSMNKINATCHKYID